MLLCIAMYQLSHLLEFQAGHIRHDLRVSQSDDVDLLVQENRSHDPAMLKGVNPVRHKAPWPELCFFIEESILRLSRPEMSIRNSDVPLHQIGACHLRRNKIPSKVGGRSPWRGEKPKEENKRHVYPSQKKDALPHVMMLHTGNLVCSYVPQLAKLVTALIYVEPISLQTVINLPKPVLRMIHTFDQVK